MCLGGLYLYSNNLIFMGCFSSVGKNDILREASLDLFPLDVYMCVRSSTCYMLSSKICIPLAMWGHLWEVRIFWLDFTALKHCLRLVLSLGLELG